MTRSTTIRASIVLAGVAALLLPFGLTHVRGDVDVVRPSEMQHTLVLNVTAGKDDLHAATMALQLANHGLDNGSKVVIFLNVRAPVFAAKDAPAALKFGDNPPVPEMLAKLIERDAQVLVCPACAKAMKVAEGDLIDGATFATRESLFGALDATAHVFSY